MDKNEYTYEEAVAEVHEIMKRDNYQERGNDSNQEQGIIKIYFEKATGEYDKRTLNSFDLTHITGWESEKYADEENETIDIILTKTKKPLLYKIMQNIFKKGE
ncbi:hypothetical protein [Weissella confusa]|uniref:hypothetical protein n=1 Tax=Weissella confusa TaxID=1583 RepID=UPI0018F1F586|nr:hypothetical protein [Weissella confusa]MBJ7651835.1 hypothetical protein [Weissella confusa]